MNRQGHVVLLGDSIFDNQTYVPRQPCVRDQLASVLGAGWQVTLLAVDGSVTEEVAQQLAALPTGATHLVISTGGNDAIRCQDLLTRPVRSAAEVFSEWATVGKQFVDEYSAMLHHILETGLPTTVCTIYDPNYDDPLWQRMAAAGLTSFNDGILRLAVSHGIPVIDLRVLFHDPQDYANPIEPSVNGGAKLAEAIARVLHSHDFGLGQTTVYAGTDPPQARQRPSHPSLD